MARNQVSSHNGGVHIYTAFTAGTSGQPVCIGTLVAGAGHYANLTGTLLDAVSGGSALVDTSEQIFDHLVHGLGPASTNLAVAIGDALYMHVAAPNITDCYLNKNSTTGTLFGFALEPVVSGGTDTIWVRQKG